VSIGRVIPAASLSAVLLIGSTLLAAQTGVVSAKSHPYVLGGEIPAIVRVAHVHRLGTLAPLTRLTIAIALKLRNPSEMDHVLASESTPGSSLYGRYLTQSESNRLFSPTLDQQAQVIEWLRSNGLSIAQTFVNRLAVDATGTALGIERLFHVSLVRYHAPVYGHTTAFFAPATSPVLPARFRSTIQSVLGLDSLPHYAPAAKRPFDNGIRDGSTPYFPQDIADAYDVNALWAAGYQGAGQHIGITLWTPPPSDKSLNRFARFTKVNIPTRANGRLIVHKVNGGNKSKDQDEGGMDVEFSSGLAPAATVDFWLMHNSSDPYDYNALNMAGTTGPKAQGFNGWPLESQITNSWGGCEDTIANQKATNDILKADSITGHNFFFSSGDEASYCAAGKGKKDNPWPNYPTSSAYVTSVGGTAFSADVGNGTTPGAWPGETAWVYSKRGSSGGACDRSPCPEGSGGGFSRDYGRPEWQNAVTTNLKRGYPDISALADPNTGVYSCDDGYCPNPNDPSGIFVSGGTSLSSPIWAGVTADVNSLLAAQKAPLAGFIDPALYSLAGKPQEFAQFHDIVKGTNGVYKTAVGWDPVTGLGSPDAYNLARDWLGITLPFWQLKIVTNAGTTSMNWETLRKVTSYNVCDGPCLPNNTNQVNVTPITSATADFQFVTTHTFVGVPTLQPIYPA
jgi:kumamolisin